LKRADQVNLVRALAGQLGMIAMFPAQLTSSTVSGGPAKAGPKEKKAKGPAKQAPSNPLSGSAEKKAFDAAKKAVAKATKDAGGQKLPATHPLVLSLEARKDEYFRALSSAKGRNTADDDSSADEKEAPPAKAGPSKTAAPPSNGSGAKAPTKSSPPKKS